MTPQTSTSKKLVLSFGFIIISAAYAVWSHFGSSSSVAATLPVPSAQTNPIQITTVQPQTVTPAPIVTTPTPRQGPMMKAGSMMGQYANGSYTGSAVDAYYGIVQVKAIVKNGQLADVQFLQYPSDRQHSLELSNYAMPALTQEAIQAQSAQVNGVSGATATSDAFVQSLSSALALAKN